MINKNIEDAKNGIHNIIGKASIKVKSVSLENKLQLAFYKLGEAVYNAEYSDAENRPDGYTEIINEIDEIIAAIDEQEVCYNELNNKTKCPSCGNYSRKDAPFCAYCGAKKVSEPVENPVDERKDDDCSCESCSCCDSKSEDSVTDPGDAEDKN